MMVWIGLHPQFTPEMLGFIPSFLNDENPEPAKVQIDNNYRHGGGWQKFDGHTFDPGRMTLSYPGDPPLQALALLNFRDEVLYFFDYAWLLILQKDGSWEVSRLD